MKEISELIKQDAAAKDKVIEIEWKHADEDKRIVLVNMQEVVANSFHSLRISELSRKKEGGTSDLSEP